MIGNTWGDMFFLSERVASWTSFFLMILLLGSCANVYRDFQDKTTDNYYFDLAKQYLDRMDYDNAILHITPLLSSQPTNEAVVKLASEAYAGRAGLRIFDFILELTSVSDSSFFAVFAQHFPLADEDDVADLETAISLIESFEPTAADRSEALNTLITFLYYARVGVILNYRAFDTTNSVDTSFDACDTNDFPDEDAQSVVRSIPLAIDSASNLDENVSGLVSSLTENPALVLFLSAQDAECPADSAECGGIRSLINEGDAGIGIGSGGIVACP